MFLAEILKNHFRSVAIIGMAKNTGKTFTFNQLLMEGQKRGLKLALTSIGLDGEERDSLLRHKKPPITVFPGMIVATAKQLLLASRLDCEILGTTGAFTPLGEVVVARVLSQGRIVLAGPGTGHELASLKEQLAAFDLDLLLVDGAADRRSLSAPLVTDTAVLAVGVEAAWERRQLLAKLQHLLTVLTLPGLTDLGALECFQAAQGETKLMVLSAAGAVHSLTRTEFAASDACFYGSQLTEAKYVYVRGMLPDAVLTKILGSAARPASFTLAASAPTAVFLGPGSLQRLAASGIELRVLRPLHLSAVTVSPFHSRYGYAHPLRLLEDVGRLVYPVPCFDLRLGLRYVPDKEEIDAVPGC